jgi:hypothetical protein
MARGLYVPVFADISQYIKGLREADKATSVFAREVTVDSQKMAQAQVTAAVKTTEALKTQVVAYRELAAAAEKGSAEQVAAANLAARAEERLAASLGAAGGATARTRGHARGLGKDFEHMTRGAISGSGALHGFTRSLAFASGGFLAFEGVSKFLTDSVTAAREAGAAQRSLSAQMKASGESFADNRKRIEQVAVSYGKFGFQNDEVIQSLTVLERATGSIDKAIQLQGVTADLARAKNIGLADAAAAVGKVFGGQETALRRAVPGLSQTAHGYDLIQQAAEKLRGQAAANTTASEKFGATLHDTEEIVGRALLPTLNKYLGSLGDWLQKQNESGQLQKNVNEIVKDAAAVLHIAAAAFKTFSGAVGGATNAIKLLGTAFVVMKARAALIRWGLLASSITTVGTEAELSAGKVRGLSAALGKVPTLVAVTLAVNILTRPDAGGPGDKLTSLHDWLHALNPANWLKDLGLQQEAPKFQEAGRQAAGVVGNAFNKGFVDELRMIAGNAPLREVQGIFQAYIERVPQAARNAFGNITRQRLRIPQQEGWFDALISRLLGDVQDVTTPQGQIAALQQIRARVQKSLAATKDLTRRINLGETIKEINRQIRSITAQITADAKQAAADIKQKHQAAINAMLDAARFNVDKAGLTKSLDDDLKAWRKYQSLVREQIKIQGKTAELEQRLLESQQGIAAILQQQAEVAKQSAQAAAERVAAINKAAVAQVGRIDTSFTSQLAAAQYRALGLTASGGQRAKSGRWLRRRLAQVERKIKGTAADTVANRARLARIRFVLDTYGTIEPGPAQEIEQELNDIAGDTSGSGFGPTGPVASSQQITAGIAFASAAARRMEEGRVASLIAHGGHLPGAVTVQGHPIEVHTSINLDGSLVARTVTQHQQKQVRHRAVQTSGINAGRALQ